MTDTDWQLRSLHTFVNALAFRSPSDTRKHINPPCWSLPILHDRTLRHKKQFVKLTRIEWCEPRVITTTLRLTGKERRNKTVRVSAIPTVIFITTTWVGRERERSQRTVKEVYHYKRFSQTNTLKIKFQSSGIQVHAESGEKEENKQRESKTKIIRGYRSRMRRHIHRLESVILGRWQTFFYYKDVNQQVYFFVLFCFFGEKKRFEYRTLEKARLKDYSKNKAGSINPLRTWGDKLTGRKLNFRSSKEAAICTYLVFNK